MNKKFLKKLGKRAVLLCLCAVLLGYAVPKWLLVIPLQAVSMSESDAQTLKKMEEELAILKEKRSMARDQYQEAMDAYDHAEYDYMKAYDAKIALDADISALETEINATQELLNVYNTQLTYYSTAIEEKQAEIDKRYGIFLERVRANYEDSFTSYLEIVLSSDSFSDLLYRVDIVASLLDYDQRVLAALDTAKKDLTEMQTEYQSLQFRAQETLTSLTEQMPLLEDKRSESAALLAELDQKMAEAYKSKETAQEIKQQIESSYNRKAAELEKAEAEIEEKIRKAQEEAARKAREEAERKKKEEEERRRKEEEERKNQNQTQTPPASTVTTPGDSSTTGTLSASDVVTGTYIWPTESSYKKVSSSFGWRVGLYGQTEFHNGIDIPCAYNSAIYASDGGTVIIAEEHYSYGRYIVIDHGNGISTLYAHNTSLLVKVGDVVKQGQQIAMAGSTGDSNGNHCHFSVRIDGSPTDPLKYVSNK